MRKKLLSLPPDIINIMKGGDFMGLENDMNRMISEGSPVQAVRDPVVKNSRHPERKGRGRLPSASEIAENRGEQQVDQK